MPFQAVAWAWRVPVTTAEERLALIWLSNEACAWNGLAYNFKLADLSAFLCVSDECCLDVLDDLRDLGPVRGFIVHGDRVSVTMEFPVMDWDADEPIVNVDPIPPKVRREVTAGAACFACGSLHDIQADHIFPRARGGLNLRSNLQPLCGDCNRRKRDRIGWVAS